MTENPRTTLVGTVGKIIGPVVPDQAERAHIVVEGAEHLYKELRIENRLTDASGNEVYLKSGTKVDVTVEAKSQGVTAKIDCKDEHGF